MIHNISRFIAALALLAAAQGVWATNKTLSGSENYTAQNGDVLTGSTSGTVTIASGANITLSGATITGGIVCEGTATITLDGTNSVNVNNASLAHSKAGIQIGSSGTTLTIRGDGSLTATGGTYSAGIGLGRTWDASVTAGAIVIEGGTVNASGDIGIGIGTVGHSQTASIDGISIKGGTVSASLGKGNIYYGSTATVGYIKIYDTIDMVDASKITETVTYMHVDGETATDVTANKTDYFTIGENGDRRIIVPKDDTDYTITIAEGIEHGTLTVAAATAKYMQTVTVTATPAFGYRFVRLIVKDAQNNDVASTNNTFQMPKGGATVSAEFEQGVHGTTEFVWGYDEPDSFVNEATIYDGVTTVNIQNTDVSYNIRKYEDEYRYSKFQLDNDTYEANIPYAGGTGEFQNGYGTNFNAPYDGETGYYDITLTDVGNGKWSVSIQKTAAQMDVVPDQTYTGSAITPEPLVIAGSLSLTKGEDYTYSYENNTNVGTATVRATFQGTYASLGYVEKTFTIAPWSGTGDFDDPYMIYNKDQLLLLAHRVNGTNGETANTYQGKYFKLGADITFTHDDLTLDEGKSNYEAIGGYIDFTDRYFCGKFDGANHTVSGIRICKDGGYDADSNQGLFGCIGSGAEIYDVHLTDARITGYECVGGIVGYNEEGFISGCSVTDSYITATGKGNYGTICGFTTITDHLSQNYYHGCTVNGTAVTSGVGCQGADLADYNGALPAYAIALGENITTPPGTFASQTGWLTTPPVDPRLAPENGFTLAGNHYFASGYVFTPGSTLASGAAQGYTPRATLDGELLNPYTPTGEADPLAGTAIAQFTVNADCDGKTLASTQAIYSTGQPVTVAYINADGTAGEANAIALDGTETSLAAGTYFAGLENVNFDHKLILAGDVTLILKDGCTMNVGTSESRINGKGIDYNNKAALTVFGQSLGSGALSVYTTDGGYSPISVKALTVNGGNVIANTDGMASKGIYANSDITINGGSVTAYCTGTSSYGIYANGSANVTINGGTVNATAKNYGVKGTITLGWNKPTDRISITASSYDGTVQVVDGKKLHNGSTFLYGTLDDPATALNGKTLRPAAAATYTTADGTADTADAILLDASDNSLPAGNYLATGTLNYTHGITLNGNVTLILADNCHMNVGTSESRIDDRGIGNSNYNIDIYAQSLGTGALTIYNSSTNTVKAPIAASALTINGGIITADASGTNAICATKDVTINRGTVTANGHYSGIHIINGDITIAGGTVNATAGTSSSGINAREGNVAINGGNVTATGGNYGIRAGGNYAFSWRTPADRITIGATGLYAPEGKTATFARLFTDGTKSYTGTLAASVLSGFPAETTLQPCLALADAADNTAAIDDHAGQTLAVALTGRTLYKDGSWNTLCLPFSVTDADATDDVTFTGTPLQGATVMELDVEGMYDTDKQTGFDTASGTLYLYFKPAASILAGKPYIVKWNADGTDIESPVFSGVTIDNSSEAQARNTVTAQNSGLNTVQFIGSHSPVLLLPGDKSKLFLGTSTEGGQTLSTLYYPDAANNDDGLYHVNSCRAHFHVDLDGAPNAVRAFVLNFGDAGDPARIISISKESGSEGVADAWFTLDGRRLAGKPGKSGVYIHGSKKVIVK